MFLLIVYNEVCLAVLRAARQARGVGFNALKPGYFRTDLRVDDPQDSHYKFNPREDLTWKRIKRLYENKNVAPRRTGFYRQVYDSRYYCLRSPLHCRFPQRPVIWDTKRSRPSRYK